MNDYEKGAALGALILIFIALIIVANRLDHIGDSLEQIAAWPQTLGGEQ
jgi:hypothetical protein